MVISYLKVSNVAPGSTAAGSEAALVDFAVESKVALVETAADSKVAYQESVSALAPEARAPASAILRLKLPNRELAAPKHRFGASKSQAALNRAST